MTYINSRIIQILQIRLGFRFSCFDIQFSTVKKLSVHRMDSLYGTVRSPIFYKCVQISGKKFLKSPFNKNDPLKDNPSLKPKFPLTVFFLDQDVNNLPVLLEKTCYFLFPGSRPKTSDVYPRLLFQVLHLFTAILLVLTILHLNAIVFEKSISSSRTIYRVVLRKSKLISVQKIR